MGFEVDVADINAAATKLGAGTPPKLSIGGSPNVGSTARAAGFAGDYEVWLATRQDDLDAAQQQVGYLVESIQTAAKNYHSADSGARDAFLKSLNSSIERIDR